MDFIKIIENIETLMFFKMYS